MTKADLKLLLTWRPCSVEDMNSIAQLRIPVELRPGLAELIFEFQANTAKRRKVGKSKKKEVSGESLPVRASTRMQGKHVDVFDSDEEELE